MRKTREGTVVLNTQGCEMKCIKYKNSTNVDVVFLDKYRHTKNTCWSNFIKGKILNPYYPSIYGVGIAGNKYAKKINGSNTKEYQTWCDMLYRTSDRYYDRNPTYVNTTIVDEWIYFDNFYEWIHQQENFRNWINIDRSCLDKDILYKGNKLYSPEMCCLVPNCVNTLFVKKNANRGNLPIGVTKNHERFMALCSNPFTGNNHEYLGTYDTPEEAFNEYKIYKESIIKQVAQREFDTNNITKECYEAMINYVVEIDD